MESVEAGDIVQISPDFRNRPFAACLAIVAEVKSENRYMIYVQSLGEADKMGGQAYLFINKDDFVKVGKAEWVIDRDDR